MTAEIAVINKSAIALAADSAVTISTPKGVKIYNTVNKLFSLSKTQPVAAMIYGGASLVNIPWEPLIKTYRSQLKNRSFETLEEYSDDFFGFLNNNPNIIPSEAHEQFAFGRIFGVWLKIREDIDKSVETRLRDKGGAITDNELKSIVGRCVDDELSTLRKFDYIDGYDEDSALSFIKQIDTELTNLRKDVFENLPTNPSISRKLRLCAAYNLTRQAFDRNYSGIVIAGYGTGEIFPTLTSYIVDGTFNKKLRIRKMGVQKIGIQKPATILSFAQSDMITTFMEGVNPDYRDIMDKYLKILFSQVSGLVDTLLQTHSQITPESNLIIKKEIDKSMAVAAANAIKKLAQHRKEVHVDPITQAVGVLPKEELASMAESLVHLTSLKRRVSMDDETVGGPIDVAVISRGDGMVWIKRKHYFDKELNHHFFANYFNGSRDE